MVTSFKSAISPARCAYGKIVPCWRQWNSNLDAGRLNLLGTHKLTGERINYFHEIASLAQIQREARPAVDIDGVGPARIGKRVAARSRRVFVKGDQKLVRFHPSKVKAL